jgi:hypothetical protein
LISEIEQVDILKDQFLDESVNEEVRISILDLLAEYGDDGIAVIQDLILDSYIQNPNIKKHALEIIKRNKFS